jgi:hypothetical protein
MRNGTPTSRSDGFKINALPAAIAGAHFQSGIIAGKLNGVMPATTPSAWRIEYMSIRNLADASSSKSMALSGKNRSVIKRLDKRTAASMASSLIANL